MDHRLPALIMPWVIPAEEMVRSNQEKAAFQDRMMDHYEALQVDSARAKHLLTAIICTIGIMTKESTLVEMVEAGARALRVDLSSLTKDWCLDVLARVQRAVKTLSETSNRVIPVATIFDIKGPFILTGILKDQKESVSLEAGNTVRVTTHPSYDLKCSEEVIYVDYKALHTLVQPGFKILIDMARIELTVRGVVDNDIVCLIICGGKLCSQQRVTVPEVSLDLPDLTEKDWADIDLAIAEGVDAVFLPPSATPDTVKAVRTKTEELGKKLMIFSKMETRQCYDSLEERLCHCDGMVIDRGALSIELSTERVIQAQKTIAAKCNKVGKPVYCMTDFVGSMARKDCPTIAEVSDVTSTVLDGVDGLVLNSDISVTSHARLVVQTLSVLCREAESQVWQREISKSYQSMLRPPVDPLNAICLAAVETSIKTSVAAILVCTTSGIAARTLASYRPRCPIIAVSRYASVVKPLTLFRGLWPVHYIYPGQACWPSEVESRLQSGAEQAKGAGLLSPGDLVILLSSWRQGAGLTNHLRLVYVSPEKHTWAMPKSIIKDRRLLSVPDRQSAVTPEVSIYGP